MNIVLKRNPVSTASWYPQYVRKTIYNTLEKFSSCVGRIAVYLSNKKGKTKTCLLVIHTTIGERIVVKNSQENLSAAIQNALRKAQKSLAKKIGN